MRPPERRPPFGVPRGLGRGGAPPPPVGPRSPPREDDGIRLALTREAKIDVRRPDPFTGKDRKKWKPFITECLLTFNAKPFTYEGDREKVAFASSYLTETAQSHFTSILQHNPHHPTLTQWEVFAREFGGMFGVANVQIEAEQALRAIHMDTRDRFSNHVTRFEEHAFETGWNHTALQSELYRSLPTRLKEVMKGIPRPTSYQELRGLAMQLDQRHWEYEAETRRFPPCFQTSFTRPPPAAPRSPQPTPAPAPRPQRAAPRPSGPNPGPPQPPPRTSANEAPRISNEEWERRRANRLCLRCGEAGHFSNKCPTYPPALGRATFIIEGEDGEIEEHYEMEEEPPPPDDSDNESGNEGAILDLPGEA